MRQILKDMLVNKKIFMLLFIGFLITSFPILIALSTHRYYDEQYYDSVSGRFNFYYSVQLKNVKGSNLDNLQEMAASHFKHSSVITERFLLNTGKNDSVTVIGLLNEKEWSPPLMKGKQLALNQTNHILVGKLISHNLGPIQLFDKASTYTVSGIVGKEKGYEYNFNVYIPFKGLPNQAKQVIDEQNVLPLIVRSNQNPQQEINRFVADFKQQNPRVTANIQNMTKQYEQEKNSNPAAKEILSYPYKLTLIAVINCMIVSYLWIYLKRKEISLRKALGASHLNLFAFLYRQLLICALFAEVISLIIQWLLSKLANTILDATSYDITLNYADFLIGLLLTLAVALITSLIPFIHTLKIAPAKALKE